MIGMGVTHMVEMGAVVSVVAPALVLGGRRLGVPLDRVSLPALVALPLFLAVHSVITMTMPFHEWSLPARLALHVVLLVSAILFWLPVLGQRHRLSDPARMVYLYLAMPVMDLAGVYVVLRGDAAGGLAMIVAMLPVGLAAVAVTWRWMLAEEAQLRSGMPTSAASTLTPTNSHAT